MFSHLCRPCLLVLILGVFFSLANSPARSQEDKEEAEKIKHKKALLELFRKAEDEYRQFFKRPDKTHEFWTAMKFEISVGKFELAAFHLKALLEKQPEEQVDKELVQIQEVEGYYPFLRLQDIKKWSDYPPFQQEALTNVQVLLKRLTAAVEKYLGDPERINRFIARLDAPTPEERGYAFVQLQRSRERAVPYLVESLRTQVGKPLRARVVQAFQHFDRDFFPPMLETFKAADAKDAQDIDLRVTLLEIFRKRADKRCLPYLWHLAYASMYPAMVRDAARETLIYFLEVDPTKVPPAKVVLTDMAEKYYKHQMKFPPGGLRFWKWDGQNLALKPDYKNPRDAEEFFGLRYAREALDLDPSYKPAQIVFLNLILERSHDQDLDKFFFKPMAPDLLQLLSTIDSDLIMTTLERALDENNLPIVLPLVQVLGQRGELRAALPNQGSQPRGLVRALFYPDRRVQFAALSALVHFPQRQAPVAAERIVNLLARFLDSEGNPRALIAFCPKDQAAQARANLKEMGFEPEVSVTLQETFAKLIRSADYDVLFIHASVPTKELLFALTQLRGDVDQGRLPLFVLAKKENIENWTRLTQRFANTWVVPDTMLLLPEEMKNLAEEKIKVACGAKLSIEERKRFKRESMDYLWKMGRGEIPGFEVRPAEDALAANLLSEEMGLFALETIARFPGRENQARLATLVLDPKYAKLKLPAAFELNRHIQKNGLQLDRNQINNLKEAHQNAADNPPLRAQLAFALSHLRTTPQQTGSRLSQFTPQPPQPPAQPQPKEEK